MKINQVKPSFQGKLIIKNRELKTIQKHITEDVDDKMLHNLAKQILPVESGFGLVKVSPQLMEEYSQLLNKITNKKSIIKLPKDNTIGYTACSDWYRLNNDGVFYIDHFFK